MNAALHLYQRQDRKKDMQTHHKISLKLKKNILAT